MASKTLYQKLVEKIEQGSKFSIYLEKKQLIVDGKDVLRMRDGFDTPFFVEFKSRRNWRIKAVTNHLFLGVQKADSIEQALAVINDLYQIYKYSRPSERSDSKSSHTYFKALPELELSTDDMLNSESREVARFRLEYHVLAYIMLGILKWDDTIMHGHWFYKSPIDQDLIILRSWLS